jgi:hypothetical protein
MTVSLRKSRAFLREISDSEPRPAIHGHEGDIHRIERHGPAVGLDHAQDHAKSGGFSRPVAAQQAEHLLLAEQKTDIVDDNVRPL